jgi:hypothetical protein
MVKKADTLKGLQSKQKTKHERTMAKRSKKDRPAKFNGKSGVRTASDLGIAASSLGIGRKAATHKGRKILAKRAPQIVENPKKSIVMRGRNSSQTMN